MNVSKTSTEHQNMRKFTRVMAIIWKIHLFWGSFSWTCTAVAAFAKAKFRGRLPSLDGVAIATCCSA